MKQRNKNRIIKYAHHENERRRVFREAVARRNNNRLPEYLEQRRIRIEQARKAAEHETT